MNHAKADRIKFISRHPDGTIILSQVNFKKNYEHLDFGYTVLHLKLPTEIGLSYVWRKIAYKVSASFPDINLYRQPFREAFIIRKNQT